MLALPLAASLVLAGLVSRGQGTDAVLAAAVFLMTAVALLDWRLSVYGLLLYMPFSGIPSLATYPHNGLAELLKDLLFVLPAYLGFAVDRLSRGKRLGFAAAPTTLLALFALLVALQTLNPNVPTPLVALIGAKVWLLYIPLLFLGYHIIDERGDVNRVLKLMSLAAILPAALGIVESILLIGGHGDVVARFYGNGVFAAATQQNAVFTYAGGGHFQRVPSTFTFVAQYYLFTSAMVAVSYAWWRGQRSGGVRGAARCGVWVLMLVAGLLSGSRGAFIFIPFLVTTMIVLNRGSLRLPVSQLLLGVAAFVVAAAVIGASSRTLLGHSLSLGGTYIKSVFIDGLGYAVRHSLLGLGTGLDTVGSRYGAPPALLFHSASGFGESWYVKAALELGLAGVAIIMSVFAVLLVRLARNHRRLNDRSLRAVSAAVLALLVWNVLNAAKGPYLDLDPMNVFFWLLLGVAFKLPRLESPPTGQPVAAVSAAPADRQRAPAERTKPTQPDRDPLRRVQPADGSRWNTW